MACTIEKVLADARLLVNRLKEHDNSADCVIVQSQNLHHKVNAMKQYQEDLNELNEIARHRPRANLVLSIAQENNQIRELQQENRELRASLEEHQSALELIMSKYREQVVKLLMANQLDQTPPRQQVQEEELRSQMDKICEMAAVMWKAVELDEDTDMRNQEMISQLRTENQTLRELVMASRSLGSLSDSLRHLEKSPPKEHSSTSNSEDEDEDTTKFNTIVLKSDKNKHKPTSGSPTPEQPSEETPEVNEDKPQDNLTTPSKDDSQDAETEPKDT